jgi:hypothetical protein
MGLREWHRRRPVYPQDENQDLASGSPVRKDVHAEARSFPNGTPGLQLFLLNMSPVGSFLLADHDTAGFNEGNNLITLFQLEVIDGINRDCGSDHIIIANIDPHFCRDFAFHNLNNRTLDLIPRTQFHGFLLRWEWN